MKIRFILLFLLLSVAHFAHSQSPSGYKILRQFELEGEGGWDYLIVDTVQNRLFVSHSTVVQVVDLKTGSLISAIANTKGVHGITLAYELNKGFISNGKDTS